MGELLDQFIIEAKNLAKFLNIHEVKEEPHHSTEYYPPRQRADQLFKGETEPLYPLAFFNPQIRSMKEQTFIDRQGNAIENARRKGILL